MRGYPGYTDRARSRRRAGRRVRLLVAGIALTMPAAAIAAEPVADATPTPETIAGEVAGTAVAATREAEQSQLARGDGPAGVSAGAALSGSKLEKSAGELADPGPFYPLDVRREADYGDAEAAFGNARGRPHEGQDMFAAGGTTIVSPTDGIVIDEGSDGGRGNWLAIYDPDAGLTYNFFHMNAPALVGKGERVAAGTKVGEVGCTGSCWGTHLHFEVREGRDPYGTATDPLPLLHEWQPLHG